AFLVVLACLISIAWIAICCGIAWALAWRFDEESISRFFWVVLTVFCAMMVFPAFLDRLLGHRLDPESRTARLIEGWMRFTDLMQVGALFTPIAVTLFSNQRRRWFYNLFAVGFFALMVLVTVGYAVRREGISLLGRAPETVAPERQIHAVHYEDQWPEEGAFQLAPSIQSDVIEDPYLELFLPYRPDRHDPVFARQCPDQPRAILECAARVHRVSLDGKPVRELTFHLYEHPRTGVRGFRAYIPMRGIPRGGHLLRIEPLPRKARLLRKKAEPWLIRFWT
ncbi:MAG TPA: hypothetical protein VJ885_07730, partial [Thermoanaerobaculia bacterium]|nr:hypothetical protein [Thermoanaerobaculia bacterium]